MIGPIALGALLAGVLTAAGTMVAYADRLCGLLVVVGNDEHGSGEDVGGKRAGGDAVDAAGRRLGAVEQPRHDEHGDQGKANGGMKACGISASTLRSAIPGAHPDVALARHSRCRIQHAVDVPSETDPPHYPRGEAEQRLGALYVYLAVVSASAFVLGNFLVRVRCLRIFSPAAAFVLLGLVALVTLFLTPMLVATDVRTTELVTLWPATRLRSA